MQFSPASNHHCSWRTSICYLLLLSFLSKVEPFPITRSKALASRGPHTLYTSSKDRIGVTARIDDGAEKDEKNGPKEAKGLSGLLDEMFQARLEMSSEAKDLESLVSENNDMPTLGSDGVYRIVSQNQLE